MNKYTELNAVQRLAASRQELRTAIKQPLVLAITCFAIKKLKVFANHKFNQLK